jgi:hypothetical protein
MQYVSDAIKNVESQLKMQNLTLQKSNQPVPSDYRPELGTAPHLETGDTQYFKSQLSILR